MANGLHTTVKESPVGGCNGMRVRHNQKMQLFPALELLEFVAIDILRSSPRIANGN